MSYRAGMGLGMARMGVEPGPPRITCDGCGLRWELREDRLPPNWFFNRKAPPRWRQEREGDVRRDYCPTCKEKRP